MNYKSQQNNYNFDFYIHFLSFLQDNLLQCILGFTLQFLDFNSNFFPRGCLNILQYQFKKIQQLMRGRKRNTMKSESSRDGEINKPMRRRRRAIQHVQSIDEEENYEIGREVKLFEGSRKVLEHQDRLDQVRDSRIEDQYIINQRSMDYFQGKRSRGRYILDGSEDQFSYSSPVQQKGNKNSFQSFQALYLARDRYCDFVNTLGDLKYTEIREDILIHCQQNSRKQRIYEAFMSDEMILKIINLRIQKMIKNKRIKKNWSEQDVQILIWVISKYADKKRFQDIEKQIDSQDWQMIASLIPGVTGQSCMFKWLSLKKINLATNNWSEEESNLLSNLVNQKAYEGKSKDSKDWKAISQRLYFLNNRHDKIFRNAKQCREHWNCYLNPNLKKGPWKPEQDIQLLKCIKHNKGSKKWSQIVKYFDGRTQNALKNRYTLIIEKQKKHNKHKNELQIIEQYLVRCYLDQFTAQIKQDQSSEHNNDDDSDPSIEQMIMRSDPIEQRKIDKQVTRTQEDFYKYTPVTPITPIKIQKFGGFKQFLSRQKFDFNSIQLGTLNNGIFEKTEVETDKSLSGSPECKFKLKKYHSSLI